MFVHGRLSRRIASFGLIATYIMVSFFCTSVAAHSGGTDKYGCHAGSQPYHCHSSLTEKEQREMLKSIERQYLLNGLTAKGKFIYKNKRYKTCVELNSHLLRGISKSKIARESLYPIVDRFSLVSPSLYKKNIHLDADKDGVACGLLEPENSRVQTISCNKESASPSDGLSIQTSFKCSLDSKYTYGWLIEIVSTTPNATDAVLAEDERNELPYPGMQYFLVTVKVTNLTGKRAYFSPTVEFGAIGLQGKSYDFRNDCGIIPNAFNPIDIANGESRIGNYCWEIDSLDADSIAVFWKYLVDCKCNMYTSTSEKWYVSVR